MNEKSKGKIENDDLWEIMDNLHDEIMVYDDDYNLIYVNKAAERHYDKKPEELIGMKFSELDEVYWGNSTLPEVYKKKNMVAKRQITILGSDIITISVPIFDKKGNIKYVVQNVNDIYNYNRMGTAEEKFLQISNDRNEDKNTFIYSSTAMRQVLDTLERVKNVSNPCLILGETGTGKSFLAKHIHESSNRSNKPFVTVNCACVGNNLFESEFFGYKKGAFSGASATGKKGIVEIADGGTLFLDEISEIPYDFQGKLLQFIQDQEFMPVGSEKSKTVDVKIIAATNRNLSQMVQSKSFRKDLYYRLNFFEVTIPPLRERSEDTKTLIQYYLKIHNQEYCRNHIFTKEAIQILLKYKWPGNVRELSHIIEKVVLLTNSREIHVTDLPKSIFDIIEDTSATDDYSDKNLEEALAMVEKNLIMDAYKKYKNSVKVAKALGITQSKAYRLIKKYMG